MRKPAAVRALLGIQERIKPDVLFLSETHLDKAKAGKLKRRLGFDEMEVSQSDQNTDFFHRAATGRRKKTLLRS